MSSLARRKIALAALFGIPGLGISSWVTRTPAIRDALEASTGEMGLILFGLSLGSLIGVLNSGPSVSRFGARNVTAVGTALVTLGVPLIGLGAGAASVGLTVAGLAIFGLGIGSGEVAMNVEGAQIERESGRAFLPLMHGCFSLGTVIGASLGIFFTAVEFSVMWHLVIMGAVNLILFTISIGSIPVATGKRDAQQATQQSTKKTTQPKTKVWKDPALLLIGMIVLAMAMAEGTANDWLPLVMVDEHGFQESWGSAVYALFAASMTLGRFIGNPIVQKLGKPRVLAASAVLAAIGLLLVSQVDGNAIAIASVVLWGLGASLGFPVALSAAGESGENEAARVSLASTIGYIAFLVGPPVLGIFGEHWGLANALLTPMVLVLIASGLAGFVNRLSRRRQVPQSRQPE